MRPPLRSADYPDLTTDLLAAAPVERAETIPSAWYIDPRFHALDREAVLAPAWHYVGAAEQVARPGDAIRATVAGEPVLVVRDREGALRAFHNVCRHRGGPLLMDDTACGLKALTCKYHGWTYLLDGSLRGVPKWDRVELFDRKDYGLVPLAADLWEGMVFVHLDPDAGPVADALAGIAARVGPGRLATLRFAGRVSHPVAANWKVYVDNYLEGYHIPYVHPELMTLLDVQAYTTEVHPGYSLQSSPLTGADNLYSGTAGGEALYYHVFPHLMLNILPGRLQVNLVEPATHDRCVVHFDSYYDDVTSEAARRRVAEDQAYSGRVQVEDAEICERVQEGLASRAYDRGRFSVECEEAVHHFQEMLKQAYRRWLGR